MSLAPADDAPGNAPGDPSRDAPDGADWPAMLRLAATRFAVPPHRFWRLSLKEWRALVAAGSVIGVAHAPLSRAAFEALAALHPDDAP